jgi:hypothetical protein
MNATVAASIVNIQPTTPKDVSDLLPCEQRILPKGIVEDSKVSTSFIKDVSDTWFKFHGEQLPGKIISMSALTLPSGRRLKIPASDFLGVSFDTPLLAPFDPFETADCSYRFEVNNGSSGLRVVGQRGGLEVWGWEVAKSSIRFDSFCPSASLGNPAIFILTAAALLVTGLVAATYADGERLPALLSMWAWVVTGYTGIAVIAGNLIARMQSHGEEAEVTVTAQLPGAIPENARNIIRKARTVARSVSSRAKVLILAEARWSVTSVRPIPPADPIICIWDNNKTLVYIDRFDCTPVEEYISREFTNRI